MFRCKLFALSIICIFKAIFPSLALSDSYAQGHGTITVSPKEGGVVRVVINNPPINIYDNAFSTHLLLFVQAVAKSPEVKVVIFESANPDFFLSHFDLRALSTRPLLPPGVNGTLIAERFLTTIDALASVGTIFIAQINGRTWLGGNEIALACDVRFAGPKAVFAQPEVAFGVPPGGGSLQFLTALVGRARALEYSLSGRALDPETAAAIGWVNAAYPTEEDLRREVDLLARRIASFPRAALAGIKERINLVRPSREAIFGDFAVTSALLISEDSQARLARYLGLSENQTLTPIELNAPSQLELLNQV